MIDDDYVDLGMCLFCDGSCYEKEHAVTKVTRMSRLTGKMHTRIMPVQLEKLREWEDLYPNLPLIQDFFPELNAEDREFILTGITPEEWNQAFPEEE